MGTAAPDLTGLARLTPSRIPLRSLSDYFEPIQRWEDRLRSTHRDWSGVREWALGVGSEITALLKDTANGRILILDLSDLIHFPFFELATAIRRGYLQAREHASPKRSPILGLSWTARSYADSTARHAFVTSWVLADARDGVELGVMFHMGREWRLLGLVDSPLRDHIGPVFERRLITHHVWTGLAYSQMTPKDRSTLLSRLGNAGLLVLRGNTSTDVLQRLNLDGLAERSRPKVWESVPGAVLGLSESEYRPVADLDSLLIEPKLR